VRKFLQLDKKVLKPEVLNWKFYHYPVGHLFIWQPRYHLEQAAVSPTPWPLGRRSWRSLVILASFPFIF